MISNKLRGKLKTGVNGMKRRVASMTDVHLEELEKLMREYIGRGLPLHTGTTSK